MILYIWKIILKNGKFANFHFLPPEIVKFWPLISRFQLIFRPCFFSIFLLFMRLAIDSFSCFCKSLTSIFDTMGDLGPKWPPPNLALWAPNFNYRSVPRNYVSFRRVISIEKPSWTPFSIWAWVCDQLVIRKELKIKSKQNGSLWDCYELH